MKYLKNFTFLLVFTCCLYACSDNNTSTAETAVNNNDSSDIVVEQPGMAEFEFFKIYVNMPTPLEELGHMNKDGIAYNEALLAPLENANKHESEDALAINCGMYIVDMTYQAIYHNTDKLMDYNQTVHQLADKFNASKIFDAIVADKIEAVLSDKDSLQIFIEKGLENMEEQLADNKRINNATQLMLGAWVEMQYILTQSILQLPDDQIANDLKEYIFGQREHLDNLIILLEQVKNEAGLHDEMDKLKQLEASFTKIHEASEVEHEILVEVANEIETVRNDLLNM